MRTLTAGQQKVLESVARGVFVRVKVDRGNGDFVDMTDLEGRNWVHTVNYGDNIDSPVQTATVLFVREHEGLSLSTLKDDSKLNQLGTIIDIANPIIIETAVIAKDSKPVDADYVEVFRGEIDDIDWGSSPISVTARDLGGVLVDRFIEQQFVYGASTGSDIEFVMQDILDNSNPDVTTMASNFVWNGTTTVLNANTSGVVVGDYIAFNQAPYFEILSIVTNVSVTISNPRSRTIPTGSGGSNSRRILDAERVTLYSVNGTTADPFPIGDSPGFGILEYWQSKESVMAALRRLTLLIGYEVKYRWQTNAAAFELVAYLPDRSNTTPDFTFGADRYLNVGQLKVSRQDIRNVVRITFTAQPSGTRTTTVREDTSSQAKYGRRYMEIAEDATSQIDTIGEANTLGDYAISDLAEPVANQAVEMLYFWAAEPSDLYRFTANGIHYDSDQDLAVVSIQHSLTPEKSHTTIATRGKPSGGLNRWIEIEGRPGVAPPHDLATENSPENVTSTPFMGGTTIIYDDPRSMAPPIPDWTTTRVHGVPSTDGGYPDFTPTTSNKLAEGRELRFEISDLIPGETYSFKLLIIDGRGNVGATSSFVQQATETVGPVHENPNSQAHDQILRNGDFGIFTKGTTVPPDFWEVVFGGTWATNVDVTNIAADTKTGNNAIEINVTAATTPGIRTEPIPYPEGELVIIGALMKGDIVAASTDVRLRVDWLDINKAFIGAGETAVTVANGVFEERVSAVFQAPTSTRYAQILVKTFHLGTDYDLTIDRVGISREFPTAARGISGASTSYTFALNGTPIIIDYDFAEPEDIGFTYGLTTGAFRIDFPGQYAFTTQVTSGGGGVSGPYDLILDFQVKPSGGAFTTVASSSTVTIAGLGGGTAASITLESPILDLDQNDEVRVLATILGAGTPVAVALGFGSRFSGKMIVKATR